MSTTMTQTELRPSSEDHVSLVMSPLTKQSSLAGRTITLSQHQIDEPQKISKLRRTLVVAQLCIVNFLASFPSAVVTVGLPTIAASLDLPRDLYLWPSSVYGLTSGATLLLAGSIADLIGARQVDLVGTSLLAVFSLACAFANTGIQLVLFRAMMGVALSMHLPASVALVAAAVPRGRERNISFGCLGLSQPLGFGFGLVVSGIMIEKVSWRSCFYLSGGATILAAIVSMWALPKVPPVAEQSSSLVSRLLVGIDWLGVLVASAGLALLAYVLAVVSADLSAIHLTSTAVMLTISLILLLAFPLWMHYCEKHGRPALVPNSLWKKAPFTSTCIMVALSYGVINSMELFSSLYFQEIQSQSPLFTSLRLLPNLLVGCLINLTVGVFVDRVSARWLVAISALLCALATLLMAFVNPSWSYWTMELWAQMLSPVSGDVLFTVGLLVVSNEFPEDTQALAGAVFNTAAQFGMSFGLGICQVVALGVTSPGNNENGDQSSVQTSLKGFRATFWTMFAIMITTAFIAVAGLRKVGKVGVKQD